MGYTGIPVCLQWVDELWTLWVVVRNRKPCMNEVQVTIAS